MLSILKYFGWKAEGCPSSPVFTHFPLKVAWSWCPLIQQNDRLIFPRLTLGNICMWCNCAPGPQPQYNEWEHPYKCIYVIYHKIKTQLLKLIKITFCLPRPINSIAGDSHCAPCACQREPGCSVPAGGDPGYSAGHWEALSTVPGEQFKHQDMLAHCVPSAQATIRWIVRPKALRCWHYYFRLGLCWFESWSQQRGKNVWS